MGWTAEGGRLDLIPPRDRVLQSAHAGSARRRLSVLWIAPQGRSGDGRHRLGGQEEGAAEGLRRPGEPRGLAEEPARREVRALGRADAPLEGHPRAPVRGGAQAGGREPERAPAQPLRQRVSRVALLVVGLWLGLLVSSWAMATVNFRTAERVAS